jgi:hypothetical protein
MIWKNTKDLEHDGVAMEKIQAAMRGARKINLKIEEHQDWLYAWDRDTNDFLTQGSTVEELFDRLYEVADRLTESSVVFRCSQDDGGNIVRRRSLTTESDGAIIDDGKLEKGEWHGKD